MDRPEELFESYGTAVVSEIHRQIRRCGTLGPLLRQLGLPAPRSLEEQVGILLNFLEEYGPIHFLNQVSATDPANRTLTRLRKMSASEERRGETIPPAAARSCAVSGADLAPGSGRGVADTQEVSGKPDAPGRAAMPAAPSPAVSSPAGGMLPDGRRWINVPTYQGPDRRSGRDRRQGPRDRRQKLETVFVNRRFGGWDRRKEIRRREDREKELGKNPGS